MLHLCFLCEAALWADVGFLETLLGALGHEFVSWRVIQGHSLSCSSGIIFERWTLIFSPLRCAVGLIFLFSWPPHLCSFLWVIPAPVPSSLLWSSWSCSVLNPWCTSALGQSKYEEGPGTLTAGVLIVCTASQNVSARKGLRDGLSSALSSSSVLRQWRAWNRDLHFHIPLPSPRHNVFA